MTELVALVSGGGPPDPVPGFQLAGAADCVALLSSRGRLPALRRADVVTAAAARARALEALLPHGTVIPALPGQRLDAREATAFVTANRPLIEALVARLSGRVQFQVIVRWTAERAAGVFATPDLAALAASLRARIATRLAATGGETVALPVAGDVLSNTAILIPRAVEAELDGAVEEIDSIWSEGFAIRVVGPLPAVSFASLSIARVDDAEVRRAMSAYGLRTGFTADDLRAARRVVLMGAGPERQETLVRQAELLGCVARLGAVQGPVAVARVWSEGMSAPAGTVQAA
jgi:hypothetical protein